MKIQYVCVVLYATVLMFSADATRSLEYLYRPSINGWLKEHVVAATWEEADNRCRNEGAELAAPLTKELLAAIQETTRTGYNSGQYLINVKASYVPGEYSSPKGVPLDRMPVEEMVQSLDRGEGDCLAIDRRDEIRAVSCASRLPYFCYKQRKQNENLTECGTFDTEYKFNATTGSCYKFHTDKKSWYEAYSMCVAEGGHLAILNDDREARMVREMFYLHSTFLGLQALKGDGVWTSIHGDPLDTLYKKWYTFYHSQEDTAYQCAIIYSDLDLDSRLCSEKNTFLCERDPHFVQYTSTDTKEDDNVAAYDDD